MKSILFRTFVLIIAAVILPACGGKSESERSYADACVKMMKGEAYRTLCDCEAGIVASKLSPGELKVYLASPDMPKTAMTSADLSKFASEHGFTVDDMNSREEKMKTLLPEVNKTCVVIK